ncbi:MAG: rod shape-determining protein RodA, partial [Flammeovirgaceae bacterium]
MRRDDDISGKLDWTAILLYMALVLLGWLNIYAAIYDESANQSIFDLSLSSGRQLMFMVASAVIVPAIIIIDMRFYETFAYIFYGLIMFMLILVPIIGKEVGGNKAWIGIGSFGVQPSEFAKFITALAVAKYIGSVGFKIENLRNQAVLFVLIGLPMVLIQLQKDTGTALVFTSFVLMFYREGMSPFLLIVGICAAFIFIITLLVPNPLYLHIAIGVILLIAILLGKKRFKRIALLTFGALIIVGVIESVDYVVKDVLKPHQRNRIMVLVDPDIDPLGTGWNVTQSKIAIGSGSFAGKGFLKGTQTKFDFVPKQST